MRYAVIKSSELGDRWDAGFHLLRLEYQRKAAALATSITVGRALQMLSSSITFPTSRLRLIAPLVRGKYTTREPSRDQLLKAAEEYPHLALAIAMEGSTNSLRAMRDEFLERARKQAKEMDSIIKEIESSPTIEYKLADIPDKEAGLVETHNFVSGVMYFCKGEISIPVHTGDEMFIADCWVIDKDDWHGVETINELIEGGSVPVPRRHQDLGHPIGFVVLPGHEQNYGRGWG